MTRRYANVSAPGVQSACAHQRSTAVPTRSRQDHHVFLAQVAIEKRTLVRWARLRPALSIIWISSMRKSCIIARSTSIICSVVTYALSEETTELFHSHFAL